VISNGRIHLERHALAETAAPMRHAVAAFLQAMGVPDMLRIDVITAVGEAIANVIEHAYRPNRGGHIAVSALLGSDGVLTVHVVDRGAFAGPQTMPDRGFGLKIIRAVAYAIDLDTRAGTALTMRFHVSGNRLPR
jgi:anti-sigma regulatory factor (Ser/Thr protein kinase)